MTPCQIPPRALLFVAFASLLGVLLMPATATAQDPTEDRAVRLAQARALFQEGIEEYSAGRLHVALERLLEAQRLVRRPEIAFNIARVLERMGEGPRANHWFRVYLRYGRPTAAERTNIEGRIRALEELEQRQANQIMVAPPSDDERMAEANTFFQRGARMYAREEYLAALQAFEYAQRFASFPELSYNMALTLERLNRPGDAALHYRDYLRGRRDAPDQEALRQKIRELREQQRELDHQRTRGS